MANKKILNKVYLRYFLLLLLLIFVLSISGCKEKQEQDIDKVVIVTTLFPYYEFASEVGGDKVAVTLLLPPGAEPHHYEPKPSDIQKIDKADIFIFTGKIMEPWAYSILNGLDNSDVIVIDSSSISELVHTDEVHNDNLEIEENIEHEQDNDEESIDPHLWLDFENDEKIVDEITKKLIEIDNENKEYYTKNSENYKKKLQSLDTQYLETLSLCNKNIFFSGGHNVFSYIEEKYNVTSVTAINNIDPNAEPTPKAMKEIIDYARENEIKYILTEVLVNAKISETIASESGAEILVFNPASNIMKNDLLEGKTFISIMQDNLVSLKLALECE